MLKHHFLYTAFMLAQSRSKPGVGICQRWQFIVDIGSLRFPLALHVNVRITPSTLTSHCPRWQYIAYIDSSLPMLVVHSRHCEFTLHVGSSLSIFLATHFLCWLLLIHIRCFVSIFAVHFPCWHYNKC